MARRHFVFESMSSVLERMPTLNKPGIFCAVDAPYAWWAPVSSSKSKRTPIADPVRVARMVGLQRIAAEDSGRNFN
jgi:hypothetical protein